MSDQIWHDGPSFGGERFLCWFDYPICVPGTITVLRIAS